LLRSYSERHRGPYVVLQCVLIDVSDVDAESDLGGQVDDGLATVRGFPESIMIEDVVSFLDRPIKGPYVVPRSHELIMNRPTDESGASGKEGSHMK
jgi:hypothetical protein